MVQETLSKHKTVSHAMVYSTVYERPSSQRNNLLTLESLIIVYTRNMFFDKISLLHAVIRALHDFRRGASRGAIFFFRPENF